MKYTVTWLPDTESELAEIWTSHADRAAVTNAAHDLERRLETNASGEGESRDNGRRIAFGPPLAVIFRVHPETSAVTVVRVIRYG